MSVEKSQTSKKWAEITPKEITKLKREQCIHCIYLTRLSGTETFCDYLSIVGHSRGCSPFECISRGIFKPRAGKRRKREERPNV